MTDLERAARAIADAIGEGEHARSLAFKKAALAALTTLREPSPAMVEAMFQALEACGDNFSPYEIVGSVWQAAIDAILKEGGGE